MRVPQWVVRALTLDSGMAVIVNSCRGIWGGLRQIGVVSNLPEDKSKGLKHARGKSRDLHTFWDVVGGLHSAWDRSGSLLGIKAGEFQPAWGRRGVCITLDRSTPTLGRSKTRDLGVFNLGRNKAKDLEVSNLGINKAKDLGVSNLGRKKQRIRGSPT